MTSYTGRFAPSPTGPLHFGSLIAALASYCDAKANDGKWLVRIEDLDKPREVKGATRHILGTLEKFGFVWDGEILLQSERSAIYQAALDALRAQDLVYPCTCSRKEIADSSTSQGIEGAVYPKTCLTHPLKKNVKPAYRIKTQNIETVLVDLIQGEIKQNIAQDIGDFVLLRADHIFSYQLAVVVDDAAQGVTHVVRGADLLHSTPRQIYLQQLLQLPQPQYAHLPVVCNAQGEKLSKQTLAQPIDSENAGQLFVKALQFLGQKPAEHLARASTKEILAWATAHWRRAKIPQKLTQLEQNL